MNVFSHRSYSYLIGIDAVSVPCLALSLNALWYVTILTQQVRRRTALAQNYMHLCNLPSPFIPTSVQFAVSLHFVHRLNVVYFVRHTTFSPFKVSSSLFNYSASSFSGQLKFIFSFLSDALIPIGQKFILSSFNLRRSLCLADIYFFPGSILSFSNATRSDQHVSF